MCKISYVYALYYRGIPFYIGQSVNPYKRLNKHKCSCFTSNSKKTVYSFIRKVSSKEYFYTDISIRILKCVYIYDIDKEEMKYIKFCLDKGNKLFNDCVKTNSYRFHRVEIKD